MTVLLIGKGEMWGQQLELGILRRETAVVYTDSPACMGRKGGCCVHD